MPYMTSSLYNETMKRQKKRKCLKCKDGFKPKHKFNRLCVPCGVANLGVVDIDEAPSQAGRVRTNKNVINI